MNQLPASGQNESTATTVQQLGVVAIGRNEGERLKRCLRAAVRELGEPGRVIYVDSGSTDGSLDFARSLDVEVVELDTSVPFTAARARNTGIRQLQSVAPDVQFVQLLDGDCELEAGYLRRAIDMLMDKPDAAVVSGRRRERRREATVYNRLCDMEWETPIGEVGACHGDATMRLLAFDEVGGFDPEMIAGEEPELCVRLRQAGWKILRIDAAMTVHDAAMTRFSQWWKRAVRAGHAYAEGASLHGASPQRHNVRPLRSAMFWGGIWPIVFATSVLLSGAWLGFAVIPIALLLLLGVLAWRIFRYRRRRGDPAGESLLYAHATVLGKLPTAIGALKFYRHRLSGRRAKLIEYKGADPTDSPAGGGA